MADINRREFVGGVSASLPIVGALGCDRIAWWDLEILHAVAVTVLPSGLEEGGTSRLVHEFTAWADGIRAGAELNHGYGTGDIRYRRESPIERWSDQLHKLNAVAREEHVQNFSALDVGLRRTLLESVLADLDGSNLPSPADAPHIAIAMLSFFANSREGTDLAYRSSIKKRSCRPLNQSTREPVQLPETNR